MAEIFLSYILSSVDFIFKIAVIAFVAKQFGWISAPKLLESKETASSTSEAGSTRSPVGKSGAPNPLGDIFANVLQQMAPMLNGSLGPKEGRGKAVMSFSDEQSEEVPAASTPSPITEVPQTSN
jgi:hypothetical protein